MSYTHKRTHVRESEKKLLIDMEHTFFFMLILCLSFDRSTHSLSIFYPFRKKSNTFWLTFYANETQLLWFFFVMLTICAFFRIKWFDKRCKSDAFNFDRILFREFCSNDLAAFNLVRLSQGVNKICSIFFTMSEKSFRFMSHFLARYQSRIRTKNTNIYEKTQFRAKFTLN